TVETYRGPSGSKFELHPAVAPITASGIISERHTVEFTPGDRGVPQSRRPQRRPGHRKAGTVAKYRTHTENCKEGYEAAQHSGRNSADGHGCEDCCSRDEPGSGANVITVHGRGGVRVIGHLKINHPRPRI